MAYTYSWGRSAYADDLFQQSILAGSNWLATGGCAWSFGGKVNEASDATGLNTNIID